MTSLRAALRRRRRARLSHQQVWERELPTEVAFWEMWLRTGGHQYPWDFERRLDGVAELQEPELLAWLERTPRERARILDVGAGPLTWLGKTHPLTELELHAVDPLAEEYDRLLARFGIEPPVRTQPCRGEDLLERFEPQSFDAVFARNALDHAADPMRIIRAMIRLARPDGVVVLRHLEREGVHEHYEELHQWNFEVRNGELHLWSPRAHHHVTHELAGEARTLARTDELDGHRWVVAVLSPITSGTWPSVTRTPPI